jgi:exodeoxyribonuclease VIII
MLVEGIYLDLSSEDYHNHKESISRSSLMDFKKSPRKYWANHLNPDRPIKERTSAMEFGTMFHTFILEPYLFQRNYFVLPEKVLKKDNPEQYETNKKLEEQAEKANKIVLSQIDYQKLWDMRESLLSNTKARELLEGGVYESSYFWKDKNSGLMLKSRPDILQPNMYIDLKTIEDASPQNFQREMVKFGYHTQSAMVKDAVFELKEIELSACINICVEKTYPYSVGIYIIDEAAIEAGHHEYKELCARLKHAIVYNEFEDYPIQTIGLPKWAL